MYVKAGPCFIHSHINTLFPVFLMSIWHGYETHTQITDFFRHYRGYRGMDIISYPYQITIKNRLQIYINIRSKVELCSWHFLLVEKIREEILI